MMGVSTRRSTLGRNTMIATLCSTLLFTSMCFFAGIRRTELNDHDILSVRLVSMTSAQTLLLFKLGDSAALTRLG